MSFAVSTPGEGMYPPDKLFLDQLEFQFARLGNMLLQECQEPVPLPPQLMKAYDLEVFNPDVDAISAELAKGTAGKLKLMLKGPYHTLENPIGAVTAGRAQFFEVVGGVIKVRLYTEGILEPILYGHVPRSKFLAGNNGEPIATVFASAEMPPVIADLHELAEAIQEQIDTGAYGNANRRDTTTANDLIDYNSRLNDAGRKPHYLDEAGQLAVISMLEIAEPNTAWTLDSQHWAWS